MKIRVLFMVFLSFCLSSHLLADEWDQVKKKINEVKKSSEYIYSDVTSSTIGEAQALAEKKLFRLIGEWVERHKEIPQTDELLVNNCKKIWTSLKMPRGKNMSRSFIYVKKSDILPVDNAVLLSRKKMAPAPDNFMSTVPAVFRSMQQYTEYSAMAAAIKSLHAAGRIKEYARYASLPDPDDYYLVIYNRDAQIVALLTAGSERRNLKTGMIDSVRNYSGCGAIGLKF